MATTELTRPPDEPTKLLNARVRDFPLRLPAELSETSTRSAAVMWAGTRAAMLILLLFRESSVTGDVRYYARSLGSLFSGGSIRETLQEYPVPVLGIMLPQYLLAALNPVAFTILFACSMLCLDAAFTRLLWRLSGRRRSEAVTFWLWFVPAIGPLAFFRFDLVPAVLAGAAVLAAIRRPAIAGVLVACGAAMKLWPAILLPIFLLRRVDRRSVVWSFAITGFAVTLVSLLVGGFERLLSPVHWQSARGLQIESVLAGPVMLGRMVHPHGTWDTPLSIYKAREITGAGVHSLITFSTIATGAGIVLLAVLWNRARKAPAVSIETLGWLFLATAAIVTITNKVLSPQYILWLGGPLAALMVRAPGDAGARRASRLLLVIAALTQLNYPLFYPALVYGGWVQPIATIILETRNALLIVLTWQACAEVWRRVRPEQVIAADRAAVMP